MPTSSDQVGVQLHLRKEGTPYYDLPRVIAAVRDLGVGHVRDSFNVGWPTQNAQLGQVADECEVKLTLTAKMTDPIDAFVKGVVALGSRVVAVEGVNEWDNTGRPQWAAELIAHQVALYTAVKAALPSMPVLAPALADASKAATLGPLPCDYGNAHAYPNGSPASWLAVPHAAASSVSGGKPVVVTETGYTNALHDPDVVFHHPVTDDVAGGYIAALVSAHLAAGSARVFVYELFDQGPGDTDVEHSFGLLRNDGTAKPAYTALRRLLVERNTMATEDDVAVDEFACTTSSCKKPEHSRCVTASGRPAAKSHAPRLRDARAYIKGSASRDAEIALLQQQHTEDAAAIAALRADLAAYKAAHPDAPTPTVPTPTVPVPTDPVARYEDLAGATLNARLNASKTRAVVQMPKGTFEQADFTQPAGTGPYGIVLWDKCAGIRGSGRGQTIIQPKPMSSTKAGKIPPQGSGGFAGPGSVGKTNPYKVVHAGKTTGPSDVYLGEFTLRGTDQPTYTTVDTPPDPQTGRGHNYNGIELYEAGKSVLEHLQVQGIPGSNGANPGETFSIMSGGGAALDLAITDVEVDGRHPTTGKPIGGSGIYHGGLTPKSSLVDVDVHHMGYGWGLTHYQVTRGKSVYTRVRSRLNPGAFNWERCSDHTFELVGCDNQGTRAVAKPSSGRAQPIFAVVDSDLGSVEINLRDVKVDDGTGTLVTPSARYPVLVVIHPGYWGTSQKQLAKDIHVFDAGGVEHPDWLVTLTGYQLDGKGM